MTPTPFRLALIPLLIAGLVGPAAAQAPAPRTSPPGPSGPAQPGPQPPQAQGGALVQVIVRAQGTGDRYPSTYSFMCEEGRFCTAIFDVNRRRATPDAGRPPEPNAPSRPDSRPAPPAPTRVEIGAWSRPDGEVMFVALAAGQKLMLNCRSSQVVATKGRGEAPRIRYSVHEPDAACGSGLDRAPAEKAVAAIEVVVRPASLLRGQGI